MEVEKEAVFFPSQTYYHHYMVLWNSEVWGSVPGPGLPLSLGRYICQETGIFNSLLA
jgi:hypothetical protein